MYDAGRICAEFYFLFCKIPAQMEKMKEVAEKKAKEDRARLEAEVPFIHADASLRV